MSTSQLVTRSSFSASSSPGSIANTFSVFSPNRFISSTCSFMIETNGATTKRSFFSSSTALWGREGEFEKIKLFPNPVDCEQTFIFLLDSRACAVREWSDCVNIHCRLPRVALRIRGRTLAVYDPMGRMPNTSCFPAIDFMQRSCSALRPVMWGKSLSESPNAFWNLALEKDSPDMFPCWCDMLIAITCRQINKTANPSTVSDLTNQGLNRNLVHSWWAVMAASIVCLQAFPYSLSPVSPRLASLADFSFRPIPTRRPVHRLSRHWNPEPPLEVKRNLKNVGCLPG